MSDEIRETLNQRGANYGRFMDNAVISQYIMNFIQEQPGWDNFAADQKTATWIIIQKLSRALSGDPGYDDNWRDIAGYAQLIVDRINGTGNYAPQQPVVTGKPGGRCISCSAPVGNAHKTGCPRAEG